MRTDNRVHIVNMVHPNIRNSTQSKIIDAIYSEPYHFLIHQEDDEIIVTPDFHESGRIFEVKKETNVPEDIMKQLTFICQFEGPCTTLSEDIINFFSLHTKDA